MANQVIKVNLIPGVDDSTPILHFSQYDNGRTFIAEIYNGEDAFDCGDYNVTLECRKRDNNLVILTAAAIDNNQITFHSTEQLCACFGDNDSEIVIRDNNDLVIGSGNIIINVEKSPTCGGIQSETVIDNITQQIAHIVPEVIGEDYYNKTQTDTLLDNKANADDVYNKTQTDALLDNKANADDVYNKTQTDALLDNKADKLATYTKAQVDELLFNMLPIGKASGAIASFETEIAAKLSGLETTIVARGGGGTPASPIPIVGYSEVNFTNEDDNHTELDNIIVQLGQTVYGGRIYFDNGWKCEVDPVINKVTLDGTENWSIFQSGTNTTAFYISNFKNDVKNTEEQYCSHFVYNQYAYQADAHENTFIQGTSGNLIIQVSNSLASTVADFKSWLASEYSSNKPVEYRYITTATPFTIDLSSSDMLDAVVGINNVFSDCGVTTAYYKDTIQHYIDSRA